MALFCQFLKQKMALNRQVTQWRGECITYTPAAAVETPAAESSGCGLPEHDLASWPKLRLDRTEKKKHYFPLPWNLLRSSRTMLQKAYLRWTGAIITCARCGLGEGEAGARPKDVLKLRADPERLMGCCWPWMVSRICRKRIQGVSKAGHVQKSVPFTKVHLLLHTILMMCSTAFFAIQ